MSNTLLNCTWTLKGFKKKKKIPIKFEARVHCRELRNMAFFFFSKCNFFLILFLFLFVSLYLLPSVYLFFAVPGKFALKDYYLTEEFPITSVELQI